MFQRISNKPYLYFLLMIPVMSLASIIIGNPTLDIQYHDTYFVIPLRYLFILLLGIFGAVYWVLRKRPWAAWLSFGHWLITTLMMLVLLMLLPLWSSGYGQWGISSGHQHTSYYDMLSSTLIISFFIFLASQVLFLINLFIALSGLAEK